MVDVSGKDVTERIASARVTVKLNSEAFEALSENKIKKGDVLAVANIAGINAAKKTSELIPLTHQINLRHVKIEFVLDKESSKIEITTEVKANDKTGVEMEALTAASVSALTIYDMCKSIDRTVEISNLRVIFKSGGKSGKFENE
ncbi:MAG: cyclic pyranopterin monophosphate synthase MoaC [Candidatus Marinimicrobia bacterium]|nr:cyclic pyranopterin monophosphate synthase MoaC [Candidatus Neomarinimicrobiota bacterium]TFB09933.1 cyclic pyranopterin monophosphate synthase MoaC [Candidatus Marinimicrobia bacterium MT.SAG.2]